MQYVNVLLTVKEPGDAAIVADALRRAGELSQREPGCQRWEAYQSETEPHRFLLVEQWETPEALDRHRLAEAYTQIYSKEVLPRSTRDPLRSRRLV